ncbi:hypothetical protein FE257_002084 [Aspergillus nanangensis]|uniref:Uncharacterized protein n=1 Tax=Aspergillus nanangensis TaxID=2582783 RepID=A0AAD4CV64_ASPNN|nr:hypothetical protein FE257_002084 [Aspergillus nanangensis]
MPWSVDTSISLLTLILTGTSSLLDIWNHVTDMYDRTVHQGDSTPDASIVSRAQLPHNIDSDSLLESGLHPKIQTAPDMEPKLARRTQSV